jgi:phage baseplate assembly protein W
MTFIRDVKTPATTESGDLVSMTGIERVMIQTIRLLMQERGGILHRPDIGAGLSRYAGKPASPGILQQAYRDSVITLDALESIDRYKIAFYAENNAVFFDLTISANGETLTRRNLKVE